MATSSSSWTAAAPSTSKRKQKPDLKRANKHCPQRLPTKKAVSTLRVAPGLSGGDPRPLGRDPRFDALSRGTFDETRFRQQYAHIFEMQREELKGIKTALAESRAAAKAMNKASISKKRRMKSKLLTPEAEEALKLEVNRKSSQLKTHEQALEKQKAKSTMRKKEVAQIAEGKKPFFKKQSEVRKEELVAKYESLKNSGRLDKFMAKKRQRTASKQRRHLPSARNAEWS